MTIAECVVLLASIVGAILFGRKKKYVPMFICIVIGTAMFVLLALTLILVMGID